MTHVMKLYSAFLFVIFNAHFVESQLIGTYGQSCSYGIDDTPFATPNGCDSAGETISENRAMECPENFDCCMCGTMICGNPDTGGCDELNCNGDSGCFGVQDIQIYGGAEGALISCNGDQSCNGTKITGRNIAEIGCTGDGACANIRCVANTQSIVYCIENQIFSTLHISNPIFCFVLKYKSNYNPHRSHNSFQTQSFDPKNREYSNFCMVCII
eukprot:549763_1